ncbi:4Fe-4S binding protein [candidate division WOR-3 bacterium]|nr:4Fe-4S binding protein [candidate division WOR-3 bacterium]MCK4527036.1 4Fe-4S binding protein [candidate division WOR-3 bacterium]
MALVIYDFSKCTGAGECADACPVDILDTSKNERWCKPVNDEVSNKDVLQKYLDEVEPNDASTLILKFDMPSCIGCGACVNVCPEDALEVES